MEMINKAAYQDLTEGGMPAAQAQAVAAHIPDWSQFATKDDLAKGMSQLDTRLTQGLSQMDTRLTQGMSQLDTRLTQGLSQMDTRMSQLEVRLVRWLVGIFLTFLALLGGLVTIALNVTAIVNALQG